MITGAGGQLGCALLAAAPSGFAVTALDRRKLDIAAPEATRVAMSRYNPELILNAAAYTQVDRAETEREEAYAVNADGPQYLAEVANTIGARLIHISTDYVFNGNSEVPYRPDDPTASLNVYGASKLEGEKRVRSLCPERTLILRSGWLYDAHGKNFMMTMLKLMHEREEIRVVTDEVGTPTWAKTLARAVWLAAEQKALHGIYHWTDGGVASRYEFAAAIQEEALALGLLARPIRIRPIRTAEYPIAARRPAYTVLDKAATIADFGLTPPLAYYPTPDACRVSPCVDCSSRAAQVSSEQTSSITGSDNIVTISL